MKPGYESQTAVMVCLARAVAHGRTGVAAFSDPTAAVLLPDDARQRLEAFRAVTTPKGLRAGFEHSALDVRSKMMVARTVAIDTAIREAACPQVVILARAERLAVFGPNGTGKTTLVRILIGLVTPDAGEVDWGHGVQLGWFGQEAEQLDFAASALDNLLGGANVLLLDEPTNHLDLDTREAIEATLATYPGTIVLVSHDRRFVEAIATRYLTLLEPTL